MKRYWLFTWLIYEVQGGISGYAGQFDSVGEAVDAKTSADRDLGTDSRHEEAQVVDMFVDPPVVKASLSMCKWEFQ